MKENILTYTQILVRCEDISNELYGSDYKFKNIIAINKGSLIPTTLISQYLNIRNISIIITGQKEKIISDPKFDNSKDTLIVLDYLNTKTRKVLDKIKTLYSEACYVILYREAGRKKEEKLSNNKIVSIKKDVKCSWNILEDLYTRGKKAAEAYRLAKETIDNIPKEKLISTDAAAISEKDTFSEPLDPLNSLSIEGYMLSNEQKKAIHWIEEKRGYLTMLTGKAGAGKSTIVKALLQRNKNWKICSTTGRSALLINGITVDKLFAYNREENNCFDAKMLDDNLKYTKAIIIDEASMMGKNMFEYCYKECLRRSISLILVGDWGQSPPIKDSWIFESTLFLEDVECIRLKEVYRQKSIEFLDVLNKVRKGKVDDKVNSFLFSRLDYNGINDDSKLKIFATNQRVANFNSQKVEECSRRLDNKIFKLYPQILIFKDAKVTQDKVDYIKKTCNFANGESLCVGCKVLLLRNNTKAGYVNGDTGILIRKEGSQLIVCLDRNGQAVIVTQMAHEVKNALREVELIIKGYPIKPGYAFTAHKCQGLTIPKVWIDMDDIRHMKCHGLCYVALSRVRKPEDLFLSSWNPKAVVCDDIVKSYL